MTLKECNTYQNGGEQNEPAQLINQETQQHQRREQDMQAKRAKEARQLLEKILSIAKEEIDQDEQGHLLLQGDDSDDAYWSEDELAMLRAYCDLESDFEEENEEQERSLENYVTKILQGQQQQQQ